MRRKTTEQINAKRPLVAILPVRVILSLTLSVQPHILPGILLARSLSTEIRYTPIPLVSLRTLWGFSSGPALGHGDSGTVGHLSCRGSRVVDEGRFRGSAVSPPSLCMSTPEEGELGPAWPL